MILAKGEKLEPLKKGPITCEDLISYAAASGDNNPIHLDENFAKQAGFPSVIVHGMLSMAYLADLLKMGFPDDLYTLLSLKGRFRKVTFPGDVLTCEGEIKSVELDGSIKVSLWASSQRGEVTIDGEAILKPLAC